MSDRHEDMDQWLPLKQLEDSWKRGEPGDVNSLLEQHPGSDVRLRGEMVVLNYDLWWSAFSDPEFSVDEPPPVDVYLLKYPDLKQDKGVLFELLFVEIINWHTLNEENYLRDYPQLETELRSLFDLIKMFPDEQFAGWAKGVSASVRTKRSSTLDAEQIEEEEEGQFDSAEPLKEGDLIKFEDTCAIEGGLIGEGAFKRVYRGRQTSTGRIVAVKQLVKLSPTGIRNFLSEGRAQATIDHQNIPPVMMLGDQKGQTTLLLEKLIEAPDWSETIRDKTLQPRNLEILLTVSRAAEYAHRKSKLVHRDIKPQNVLVGEFNEIYLADWGLAARFDNDAETQDKAVRQLATEPDGYIIGPSGYMAPEMALGHNRKCRPSTDVFLLGALLYEILMGRPPYDSYPRTACLKAATHRFSDIPTSVPSELRAIAIKAMARDPEARFEDAGEFADAIERYLRHQDAENQLARATSELEKLDGQPELTDLVGIADQFRQSRELWESSAQPSDEMGREFASAGASRALKGEHEARELLVKSAVAAGDLGLASSQVVKLAETGAEESSATLGNLVGKARMFRRARNGLLVGSLIAAVALSVGVLAFRARNANLAAENASERARSAELDVENANERARNAELNSEIAEARVREVELTQARRLAMARRSDSAERDQFYQAAALFVLDEMRIDPQPELKTRLGRMLDQSLCTIGAFQINSAGETQIGRPPDPVQIATAGNRLVAFAGDKGVALDAANFDERTDHSQQGEGKGLLGLATSPNGHSFVGSDANGFLHLWTDNQGAPSASIKAHTPELDDQNHSPADLAIPLAWRPDNEVVASLANDGYCKLWKMPELEVLSEFQLNDEETDPTVSEAMLKAIKLRYPDNVEEVVSRLTKRKHDTRLCWLDDVHVLVAGRDKFLRIWDTSDGTLLVRWPLTARVSEVCVDRLNGLIAVGTVHGEVRVLRIPSELDSVPETLYSGTLAPLLDTNGFGELPQYSDSRRNEEERTHRNWVRRVHSLAISPSGFWIAVTLGDGSLSLVDFGNGEGLSVYVGGVLARASGHISSASIFQSVKVGITESGELMTIGSEGGVKKWDTVSRNLVRKIPDTSIYEGGWDIVAQSGAAGWHLAGTETFVSIGPQDDVSATWLPRLLGEPDPVHSIAAVPGSDQIVVATLKGQTILYQSNPRRIIREFRRPQSNTENLWTTSLVSISPDGRQVASSWTNGLIDFWSVVDGSHIFQLNTVPTESGAQPAADYEIADVEFCPDGRHVAISQAGGRCTCWNVSSGDPELVWEARGPLEAWIAFSNDGQWLVQSGNESDSQTVVAWDVGTGRKIQDVSGHTQVVTSGRRGYANKCAFSPDGNWLATCGTDATIRILKVTEDKELPFELYAVVSTLDMQLLLERPESETDNKGSVRTWLNSLAFSSDSRQIAVVGQSGPVFIIDMDKVEADLAMPFEERKAQVERILGMTLVDDRPVVTE